MKNWVIAAPAASAVQNSGLMVYFRKIKSVHVNRFKAYVQVLSNQLAEAWSVTDDIKQAHAVATYQQGQAAEQQTTINLSLLTRSEGKTQVFERISLNMQEKQLIKQLNLAGRKLKLANRLPLQPPASEQTIKVFGKLDTSVRTICRQLNELSQGDRFIPITHPFAEQSAIFFEHLMLFIDPRSNSSVETFFQITEALNNDQLTITQLTVVIMSQKNCQQHEAVFDRIYTHCDESTHVTLLDFKQQTELLDFLQFF